MDTSRLSYLLFRCVSCRRLLTKLEMIERWEYMESTGKSFPGICHCGGSRVSPANATLWEELTTPSIWRLWWCEIARPWLTRNGWLR